MLQDNDLDKYRNYKALERQESEYRIEVIDRGSEVTIIAPHGGRIEPHTGEIAALIADVRYNLFCFHGLKQDDNRDLHITSHRFDHPRALDLVRKSRHVIAVHGCTDSEPVAYLGGLDTELIEQIGTELTRRGVAHELSRGIRDSDLLRSSVSAAVRSALEQKKPGEARELPLP